MLFNFSSFFQKQLPFKKLLLFSVILYLIPKNIWNSPGTGLDPSWELSINLALKHHLVWGKDIIFTYGPLGYLSTFVPVYASSFFIGAYALFVSIMAAFFLHYIYGAARQKNELIFLTVFLFFHGHFLFLRDSVSLYFFTLFFVILCCCRNYFILLKETIF